jgi:hypothetical protein
MGRTGYGWLRIGSSGGLLWTRVSNRKHDICGKLSNNQVFKYPVPWSKKVSKICVSNKLMSRLMRCTKQQTVMCTVQYILVVGK